MIWRESKYHNDDCYFCLVNTRGFSAKNKHKIIYPNLQSALRPVAHDESLPVPVPPDDEIESNPDEEITEGACVKETTSADLDYTSDERDSSSKKFIQCELNDLIRDYHCQRTKQKYLLLD